MKKIFFLMLIMVFLFSSSLSVNVTGIIQKPAQSINLVVQPEYKSNGTNLTNVTYVAYTTGIQDGSIIEFYSGSPSSPYPSTLIGNGYVSGGKAFVRVFQKPDSYYIGSAVYTKPIDIWPPVRVYSNIVSYRVSLCTKSIDLNVKVDNQCKTNITYTAKFEASEDLSALVDSKASGNQVRVRFLTYEIPVGYEISIAKDKLESDLKLMKPLREDYAVINNWTAQVRTYLPTGKYLVYADCQAITTNNSTVVYDVQPLKEEAPVAK